MIRTIRLGYMCTLADDQPGGACYVPLTPPDVSTWQSGNAAQPISAAVTSTTVPNAPAASAASVSGLAWVAAAAAAAWLLSGAIRQ